MSGQRLVILDLETGGLDPLRHPITQIALLAVDEDWRELEALELKIHVDLSTCELEALKLNGYDAKIWHSQAISSGAALRHVSEFLRAHSTMRKVSKAGKPYTIARLAAHNAPFDTSFLAAWYKRAGEFCPAACFEPLCTLALARWATLRFSTPPKDHKLGTLCAYFGIELANAHDALADVRATTRLAQTLSSYIRGGVGPA